MAKIVVLLSLFTLLSSCSEKSERGWVAKKLGLGYKPQTHRDVFNEKCVHCHSYLSQSDEELISQNLIVPSNPNKSLIFRYLKGSGVGGKENMPPKSSLSKTEVQLVKTWIENLSIDDQKETPLSGYSIRDKLSEGEIYKRCYTKLTDRILDSKDQRLKEVQEKLISGTDACMLLIGNATKVEDNKIVVQSEIGGKILLNFQKLHSYWFKE